MRQLAAVPLIVVALSLAACSKHDTGNTALGNDVGTLGDSSSGDGNLTAIDGTVPSGPAGNGLDDAAGAADSNVSLSDSASAPAEKSN